MNKRWKTILLLGAILLIAPFAWLGYFFIANEAPIIDGKVIRNQAYKSGQSLDIYTPNAQIYERSPVVVFIHGGAWIGGSKSVINVNRYNGAVKTLRDSGYAVVSIDYSLAEADRSPFPTCIEDAADAISWIQRHADSLGFDLNNVGLFGESAGAHIAMMLAYADAQQFSPTYQPLDFRYVVDVYGPNRLDGIYHNATVDTLYALLAVLPPSLQSCFDIANRLFGFDPKEDSARTAGFLTTYSPYEYVQASDPPTLIIQGDEDQLVPVEQSLQLAKKLESLPLEHELHILKGMNHGFIGATEEQMDSVQHWVAQFIQRHHQSEKIP